jgi:hypothetical protein
MPVAGQAPSPSTSAATLGWLFGEGVGRRPAIGCAVDHAHGVEYHSFHDSDRTVVPHKEQRPDS